MSYIKQGGKNRSGKRAYTALMLWRAKGRKVHHIKVPGTKTDAQKKLGKPR